MADEARAMLDALMGGDRNAALPKGASLSKGNRSSSQHPSSQFRRKSCYDPDVCPLYCAWGVDLYDLFVNTKSDIGPNPHVIDEDARNEYSGLPQSEKERLGYEGMLFRKLQDLVKSCDRTVSRNKEKLRLEIQKKSGKGGSVHDLVLIVDEEQIDRVAEMQVQVDEIGKQIKEMVQKLDEMDENEKQRVIAEVQKGISDGTLKMIEDTEDCVKKIDEIVGTTDDRESGAKSTDSIKNEMYSTASSEEPTNGTASVMNTISSTETPIIGAPSSPTMTNLPTPEEFDTATKLHDLSNKIISKIYEMNPLVEQISSQKKQLLFYRSDTSSDKTVCEVSGNFMSSRDADERIAAHYAGKQYVGWKIVRDKLKEMTKRYGRGGPPSMMPHYGMGGPPPPRMMHPNDRDRYAGWGRDGRYDERVHPRYDSEHLKEREWERSRSRDRDRERERQREREVDRDRAYRDGRRGYRDSDRSSRRRDYERHPEHRSSGRRERRR